jgi:hypothetical protein
VSAKTTTIKRRAVSMNDFDESSDKPVDLGVNLKTFEGSKKGAESKGEAPARRGSLTKPGVSLEQLVHGEGSVRGDGAMATGGGGSGRK